MPELPDIEVYLAALRPRILGQPLQGARVTSPFLLRTVEPPLASFVGRHVEGLRRLGKRIVLAFEGKRFAVLHLMITGRLRWRERGAKVPGKLSLRLEVRRRFFGMNSKSFDTVRFMREARTKMGAEMRDMGFEEQRRYIEQHALKVRRELELRREPTAVQSLPRQL